MAGYLDTASDDADFLAYKFSSNGTVLWEWTVSPACMAVYLKPQTTRSIGTPWTACRKTSQSSTTECDVTPRGISALASLSHARLLLYLFRFDGHDLGPLTDQPQLELYPRP